jgi:hypothetical protein
MSRLIRPAKLKRSTFAPRLSPKKEAERVAQSKADRKKIVVGIVQRANARKEARWPGLEPKRVPHGRYLSVSEVVELNSKLPRLPPKQRKLMQRIAFAKTSRGAFLKRAA